MAILKIPTDTSQATLGYLLADGTIPLTADWDAGAFRITAESITINPLGVDADSSFAGVNASSLLKIDAGLDAVQLTPSGTRASAASATWDGFDIKASTLTITGNTAVTDQAGMNLFSIAAPTLEATELFKVKTAASLYIAGPAAVGTLPDSGSDINEGGEFSDSDTTLTVTDSSVLYIYNEGTDIFGVEHNIKIDDEILGITSVTVANASSLSGGIDDSVTTISVFSGASYSSPSVVKVQFELMRVTGVAGTDLTVVRGVGGTTAVSHTIAVQVQNVNDLTVTRGEEGTSPAAHSDGTSIFNVTPILTTPFSLRIDSGNVSFDGNLGLGGETATLVEKLTVWGNAWLKRSNDKLYLGGSKQVEVYYDGTLMQIDAGTDKIKVTTGGIIVGNIFGGQAASGNLSLISTDDPTRGFIFFGAGGNSAFDEANQRLGIAAPSPLATIHADQTSASGAIPVLILDQADVSEQCIKFTNNNASPSDADINLFTVDVTGTPKLMWDESEDDFNFSKGLTVQGDVDGTTIGGITPANLVDKSAAESITGLWNFIASGVGGLGDYDVTVGDVATPDYGIIRMGNSCMGRTSHVAGSLDLNGAVIFRNMGGPVTEQIEFVWVESAGASVIRFALPKSGAGNATYNPRSMLLAGPAVNDDDVVTVAYWQTNNSIFGNLACDTGGDGADLGVQNDLEVEGDIFTDSIKESTSGAGISLDSAVVINEAGADVNTRVEGNTEANLIFVDAGDNTVVIGGTDTSDPLVGNSRFKVMESSSVLSFRDNSGEAYFALSDGTTKAFGAHIHPAQGVVYGAFSNHALMLRAGSNKGYLGIDTSGRVGIGNFARLVMPTLVGQLDIDQSSATGARPVLMLDQADLSEQCIQFSSDSVARDINLFTVDVPGVPTLMWDESEDRFDLNKGLDIGGGISLPTVTKTGAYTATLSDHTILCDASGGAFTITLPAASGASKIQYHIKKTDSSGNAVTVDGNASETIDGDTTKIISTQYDSMMITCDGSNWHII